MESSRKRNLSFSFNVDLDNVNADSDSSIDSEATELQIDTSEFDFLDNQKNRESLDDTFVKKKEEELERQLDEKAAKTNLTATNVKNIIKHVISHELVKAMVHKPPTLEDIIFEPKLTRSKAKELGVVHPEILGPLTPDKNITSEVQVLIEGEFSEDSSDEEYDPDQDLQDDDDKDVENSIGSDMDSQSSTPATSGDPALTLEESHEVQYDKEGVFKVPQMIPHVTTTTEEENIGQRTRSKLSLKETPLEVIEQAFIPPDITSDMYECDWEPDDDWFKFLQSCYQKEEIIPQEININEDDPEDPEYNILEDKSLDCLDKEELRQDKAVKITKKELKNLIAELGEHGDKSVREEETKQQQQQLQQKSVKKKKTPDTSLTSTPSTPGNINPMVDLIPVLAEPELPQLNILQHYLLSLQLTQHVQLTTQQFLMTYKHPKFHSLSNKCKDILNSLCTLDDGKNSKFFADNLSEALHLVSKWESKLDDLKFAEEYLEGLKIEEEVEKQFFETKQGYIPKFHPELIKIMANSSALMHPRLLPTTFPKMISGKNSLPYLPSEDCLIVIGLEQFMSHHKNINKLYNRPCDILADSVKDIQKYLLPIRNVSGLIHHIKKKKWSKKYNIIKNYFLTGLLPKINYTLDSYNILPPKDQPIETLPKIWQKYIQNIKKNKLEEFLKFPSKANKVEEFSKISLKSDKNNSLDSDDFNLKNDSDNLSYYLHFKEEISVSENHELRNPVVNMLRNTLSLVTSEKNDSYNTSSLKSNVDEKSKTSQEKMTESETDLESNTSPSKATLRNKSLTKSNEKTRVTELKTNEFESDIELNEYQKPVDIDENEPRPTRLRMTTPRLAKIRSAQNMKLLVSSKASTSNSNTEENKEENKSEDASSIVKGDNEDEIAELMLASTTIKKNTTKKKTKQARELENLKRLIESQENIDENERATKFASSYLQKVHERLETKDPELFKKILKDFLDFEDNLLNANENEGTEDVSSIADSENSFEKSKSKSDKIDKLHIKLYKNVCDKLNEYPDLCSDFLLFLKPHQAALIDKAVEYLMLMKISDFFHVAQGYFTKQPSRIAKIMQAVTQMAADPNMNEEKLLNTTNSVLKGHPLIFEMFLHLFPSLKPPESLFAPHLFENIVCPPGPHDKCKEYDEDAPELYENIELPTLSIQEDPYGGDSCKCNCHMGSDDIKSKGTNEHCAACGTRFLNGRIYLQTSEGLRPAKITFPGAEEEKLENLSRVSLKTTKRIPSPPPRKRRKSSKRDSISEEMDGTKTGTSKLSPIKDNEEKLKSKKNPKTPIKSATKGQTSLIKSKCKKKRYKNDVKIEPKTDDDQNVPTIYQREFEEVDSKMEEMSSDSHEDDNMTCPEKINCPNLDKTDVSSESDSSIEGEVSNFNKWTMPEDKILLEHIQIDYSDKMFKTVSLLLKRPIDQVKERCEYLLSLLEKMS